MLLLLRAVLVLGLVTLTHSTRKGQSASAKSERGVRGKSKMVKLVMHPSVVPQIISKSTSTVANMSLSPWTYRETYVASRLPQRIFHAQCQTSGCLSLQGDGEDISLEAKPIYYQVLVLHRVRNPRQKNRGEKKGKKYRLRLGTETIAVGCTCVRPSVVLHQ